MSRPTAPRWGGHVIVCGLDTLGFRLVEELRRLGEEVVVVVDEAPSKRLAAVSKAGAAVVQGPYREEDTLLRADVKTARAIALVEQDDVGNLHAGLTAQDINRQLRIVMRLFNDQMRRSAEALLHDCVALSASAIAAPLLVAAALEEEQERCIEVGGRRLMVAELEPELPDSGLLIPLVSPAGDGAALLPESAAPGCLVLRDAGGQAEEYRPSSGALPGRLGDRVRALGAAVAAVADRRFRLLLAVILVVVTISVAVFTLFDSRSLIDALYFTITTITTTGYGDITVLHSSLPVKVYGILLVVGGAALLAIFYALLIDAVVGVRLTRALGGVRREMRNHVVVCGLGNVGAKVVTELAQRGIPVVAVERDETSPTIATARRLGVPVVIADASREESLHSTQMSRARCLITVTDDDVTNLQAALTARQLRPDLRVVVRLFDHDLAARVDRTFSISISRSVSALAAPAFAAALVDRQVLSVIPVGHQVLVVAELAVEAGSALDGAALNTVDEPTRSRVLCLRSCNGALSWMPAAAQLSAGDILTVVATRSGLSEVLTLARSQPAQQVLSPSSTSAHSDLV